MLSIGLLCAAGCVRHEMMAPEPWEQDGVRIRVSGRARRAFGIWTIRGTARNHTGKDVGVVLTLHLIDRSNEPVAEVGSVIDRLRAGRASEFEAVTLAPLDENGATTIVPGKTNVGPPRD
jgi:hypothetical protein